MKELKIASPIAKKTLAIYWQHAKKYRGYVVGSFGLLLLAVIAEISGPYFYKQFINIVAGYNVLQYKLLVTVLVFALIARTIRSYAHRTKDFLVAFLEARVMADLNITCFNYIHLNSYSFFSDNFIGSLVNKVKKMERGFEVVYDRILEDFTRSFLSIVFIVVILSFRDWLLGLSVLIWSLSYTASIYYFSLYKLKYDLKKAELDTKMTGQLADTFTNNTNIKLFSNYQKETKDFQKINEDHYNIRRYSWNLMNYLELFQSTLMIVLEVVIMFLAIKLWRQHDLTVGDFTLIQLYIIGLFDRLWGMGKQVRMFYEAIADASEMTEILLEPHEVKDASNADKLTIKNAGIKFQDVSFSYHRAAGVLSRFNLELKAGERVALIGPSGGGKSTIVKLLFRFHDLQGGKILIDGQDISKVTQDSLRDNLGLVPQDPILFHRTLMENIRYGKLSATDEEVIAAARAAHAHEFISASRKGYNTFVGERGIKLSGGERQRVAIARAILKNAKVLVLDEATSSLDSESEHYIQDALKNLMVNKTVIVIAHRLSTIMQMDRIIVLEDGKITEQGKHEELLKEQEGTYQRLWHIQAGGFV